VRFGLYYEPPSRPCKRNYRFIGVYNRKTVAYIGTVEAIAVAAYGNEAYTFMEEAGQLTDDHRKRIVSAIEATPYYDLREGRCASISLTLLSRQTLGKLFPAVS
jgi:hypothetical protein